MASQTSAINYIELQLTRAQVVGSARRRSVTPSHCIQTIPSCLIHSRRWAAVLAIFGYVFRTSTKDRHHMLSLRRRKRILASSLGEELAAGRGHEVHFISYGRPFRMPSSAPRLFFHEVTINDYGLFKYPDYTLPLSVKMAEVSRDHALDVLHVHYAVHARHRGNSRAARCYPCRSNRALTLATLHGTDTTLLGKDPGYGPAIHHALAHSDAVTVVSDYLKGETQQVLGFKGAIEVIYNFFKPRPAPVGRGRKCARRTWPER